MVCTALAEAFVDGRLAAAVGEGPAAAVSAQSAASAAVLEAPCLTADAASAVDAGDNAELVLDGDGEERGDARWAAAADTLQRLLGQTLPLLAVPLATAQEPRGAAAASAVPEPVPPELAATAVAKVAATATAASEPAPPEPSEGPAPAASGPPPPELVETAVAETIGSRGLRQAGTTCLAAASEAPKTEELAAAIGAAIADELAAVAAATEASGACGGCSAALAKSANFCSLCGTCVDRLVQEAECAVCDLATVAAAAPAAPTMAWSASSTKSAVLSAFLTMASTSDRRSGALLASIRNVQMQIAEQDVLVRRLEAKLSDTWTEAASMEDELLQTSRLVAEQEMRFMMLQKSTFNERSEVSTACTLRDLAASPGPEKNLQIIKGVDVNKPLMAASAPLRAGMRDEP